MSIHYSWKTLFKNYWCILEKFWKTSFPEFLFCNIFSSGDNSLENQSTEAESEDKNTNGEDAEKEGILYSFEYDTKDNDDWYPKDIDYKTEEKEKEVEKNSSEYNDNDDEDSETEENSSDENNEDNDDANGDKAEEEEDESKIIRSMLQNILSFFRCQDYWDRQ